MHKRLSTILIAGALAGTSLYLYAQAPPAAAGRGGGRGGRGGGAAAPAADNCGGGAGPCDKQIVDTTAADRGRRIYAAECIDCHGALARGTDTGPNLVRSLFVLRDRVGTELGPYFKKGHKMQSGASTATFTDAQIGDMSHFLKQRVNDGLRNSPLFRVNDILVGDAKAGEAFFNGAVGKCSTCHTVTGDLKGIGTRLAPPQLQQRMMFPGPARGGRGAAAAAPPPTSKPVTLTVTEVGKPPVTGVLVLFDDFDVQLRDPSGNLIAWRRTPALKVVKNDPLEMHRQLLDVITDKNMHDLTAYLEKQK